MIKVDHHILLVTAVNGAAGISLGEEGTKVTIQWETPVTIIVHGVVIAGTIISRDKYMAAIIEMMKSGHQLKEGTDKRVWEMVNDGLKEVALKGDPSGTFLHLANAKVLNSARNSAIDEVVGYWCVRMADISAFTIGQPAE